MSLLTYKYRIKDSTSRAALCKMAGAINYVWNYCNEVSLLAFRRHKTFLSAYDDPAILSELAQRLVMPGGWELILWKTRTNHLNRSHLSQRIAALSAHALTLAGAASLPTPSPA